ncbi:G-protein coupled receptor 1 [Porphyridium purpureum]|uniref:G-protein coupled receptor 1 n=1 Tax=Porphyridium purpureum TaxID=35688 RepID=A0A5J4YHZ4_PORPP|nr:G-protein coupled receptor 1 [Porphyridium purpureum]|eukprot:POR5804..scf297_16
MDGILSESQLALARGLSRGLGLVSMLASLVVIVLHAVFRRPKRQFNDPVLWLSVCTFFIPLFALAMSTRAWPWWCLLEAVGNQFFSFASFVWVTCIGHQLYHVAVHDRELSELADSYAIVYHLLSWGLSLASVVVLGVAHQLETHIAPGDLWCWVHAGPWRFIVFYIPLLVFVALNLGLYLYITITVYFKYREILGVNLPASRAVLTQRASPMQFAKQTLSWAFRASLYLIVFVVTRMGSLINRFWELAHPGRKSFALILVHICTQGLQGFLYACIYIYNESVWKRWKARDTSRAAIINQSHEHPFSYGDVDDMDSDSDIDEQELETRRLRDFRAFPVVNFGPEPDNEDQQ